MVASITELILTGSFGLAAGLGGVALQSHLQRRPREEERQEKHRDLLRKKAEQVYLEIETAQERAAASVMAAARDVHGISSAEQSDDYSPRIGRLRALVQMYFPGGAAIIDEYDVAIAKPISDHSDAVKATQADPTLDIALKLQPVKESKLRSEQTSLTIAWDALVELRSFMNEEVKKLL